MFTYKYWILANRYAKHGYLGYLKKNHLVNNWVDTNGLMINIEENENGKQGSNSGWDSLCSLHTNAIGKGVNPSLLNYRLNKVDSIGCLGEGQLNSKEIASGNHFTIFTQN